MSRMFVNTRAHANVWRGKKQGIKLFARRFQGRFTPRRRCILVTIEVADVACVVNVLLTRKRVLRKPFKRVRL